jgi:hypothetical protein
VADRFWQAAVAGEAARMREHVRGVDQARLGDTAKLLPLRQFTLGRTVIDGDTATVDTRVVLGSASPVTLDIETRLVREGEQWRVDYAATTRSISERGELADVIRQIERLGERLKDGVDQSVDELKRALPALQSELSRIEADIRHKLPELRRRLEEFSRRLQESLRTTPEPPETPPPDGTLAV